MTRLKITATYMGQPVPLWGLNGFLTIMKNQDWIVTNDGKTKSYKSEKMKIEITKKL